jgi:transcriptional regulator with XRE-family HTH domain
MTGQIIKALRTQAQMSQDELAKKSGYGDRSSIAKIESGKVDLPESKIKLFAEIFSVTPAALMGLEPVLPPVKTEIMSSDEIELIQKYKQLTEINKGRVLQHIDTLLDAQTKEGGIYTDSVG